MIAAARLTSPTSQRRDTITKPAGPKPQAPVGALSHASPAMVEAGIDRLLRLWEAGAPLDQAISEVYSAMEAIRGATERPIDQSISLLRKAAD